MILGAGTLHRGLKLLTGVHFLTVDSISFQWHHPSCESLDVSLTSCISNITCIRGAAGVTGSTVEQKLRLNYS